jgi:hypothetical protein
MVTGGEPLVIMLTDALDVAGSRSTPSSQGVCLAARDLQRFIKKKACNCVLAPDTRDDTGCRKESSEPQRRCSACPSISLARVMPKAIAATARDAFLGCVWRALSVNVGEVGLGAWLRLRSLDIKGQGHRATFGSPRACSTLPPASSGVLAQGHAQP